MESSVILSSSLLDILCVHLLFDESLTPITHIFNTWWQIHGKWQFLSCTKKTLWCIFVISKLHKLTDWCEITLRLPRCGSTDERWKYIGQVLRLLNDISIETNSWIDLVTCIRSRQSTIRTHHEINLLLIPNLFRYRFLAVQCHYYQCAHSLELFWIFSSFPLASESTGTWREDGQTFHKGKNSAQTGVHVRGLCGLNGYWFYHALLVTESLIKWS